MTDSRVIQILAVDDDQVWLNQIPLMFGSGFQVTTAASIDDAFVSIQQTAFDLILLDLNFKELRDGMDVFRKIQAMDSGTDVIVLSGETDPSRLMNLFQCGVKHFLAKPASVAKIRAEVQRVIQIRAERTDILKKMAGLKRGQMDPFIGHSQAVQRLREQVLDLTSAGFKDVLILGETGTGKDVISRYIASVVCPDRRFLPIHCGALVDTLIESELFGHKKGSFTGADADRKGVFEAAQGGVVFLDEIGEMPLSQQAKLLRVLQERAVMPVGSYDEIKVNFRTITATNRDLETQIQEKKFREDLYYRVAKVVISMPALRDRKEDIPALLDSRKFQNREGKEIQFTESAIQALKSYSWPGNIRELMNIAEIIEMTIKSDIVSEADVIRAAPMIEGVKKKGQILNVGTYGKSLVLSERKRYEEAIRKANGSVVEAAKLLGISRATYFRRAAEMGLDRAAVRRILV